MKSIVLLLIRSVVLTLLFQGGAIVVAFLARYALSMHSLWMYLGMAPGALVKGPVDMYYGYVLGRGDLDFDYYDACLIQTAVLLVLITVDGIRRDRNKFAESLVLETAPD